MLMKPEIRMYGRLMARVTGGVRRMGKVPDVMDIRYEGLRSRSITVADQYSHF